MGYFTVLLDLTSRHCVMVGGGPIAERRILSLLEAGAQVTVISPRVTPTLEALAADGRIGLESRPYVEGDLAGADLAFVATAAREVNLAVTREARARGVWINAADDPAHCTFILPAVVRRGDLTVAVATGGAKPPPSPPRPAGPSGELPAGGTRPPAPPAQAPPRAGRARVGAVPQGSGA